ncbi:hypothetical protein L3Q82_024966 [Scortum barcoo]|uniref:Uncharacterized protein n=1 Tax=Scortum barcoo TaxID=214431 RepID=A0ACB8WQT7_9TELE|nr:hypothetical protein L3Q82_024966 [Scortum barcoo]
MTDSFRQSSATCGRTQSMTAQSVSHWLRACMILQLCLSPALPAAWDEEERGRSYYDTLIVEPTATDSQIKRAYRQLAVKYHPDKNKSADAEKTFRDIAEAYMVLSNKEKRRLYDSVGHEAFLKDQASVEPEDAHEANFPFSFSDFFHDFDDSPFVEESYFQWSFHQDEHYYFEEPGFDFYFGDGDENETSVHFDPEDILCLLSSWSEEVTGVPFTLSAHAHNIKVTEVVKDGDTLTFLIVSQKLSGTGEYHVDRTYDDFEWLQQRLFSQEDVPGIQGVIFPPLPAKPQVNPSAKVMKQLGFLALAEWQPYCKALQTFLRQIAAHSILSKNTAVEVFLTSSDPPGRQRVRKNIFNRLSQAVEEMRKESHKDVDEFFQTERDHNLVLTGFTKTAAERFLEVVQTEQSCVCPKSGVHSISCLSADIAVACGHFSAALHLCVEQGEDPDKQAFSKACVKLSEVFESMKKNMTNVAENNVSTLGLGLDLESRYQEAEKEMLFRRTCKLVELEAARRNAEKAKPVKKAAVSVCLCVHVEHTVGSDIAQFQAERVKLLQQALVQWCEKQLLTAKESADRFNQHLQALRGMA